LYLETTVVIGWCLVSFSLNPATCLSLSLSDWTFQGCLVTCPGLGADCPHHAAASCYFGEKLVISEKPAVLHTSLDLCFGSKVPFSSKMESTLSLLPLQKYLEKIVPVLCMYADLLLPKQLVHNSVYTALGTGPPGGDVRSGSLCGSEHMHSSVLPGIGHPTTPTLPPSTCQKP
jgi:hypothetical protein